MAYFDLVIGTLLSVFCGALFSLIGVVIGGLFVLRTKKDGYEPILPPLREKQERDAYNLDDMAPEEDESMDSYIERVMQERKEEDPVYKAHQAFKEQMNG